MTAKEVIKALKKQGWVVDRVAGSHHILKKDGETVSIPVHSNKDIPIGLLMAIKKKAGLK